MGRYLTVRLLSLIPTLLGVTILVFLLVRLIPGTVVDQILGTEGARSEEMIQALRAYFGLDRPIAVQYGNWLSEVARGNLGASWRSGQSVGSLLMERLPVTIQLTIGAMLIALLAGIPLGIISARRENTSLDHMVRVVSLFSLSMPIFWQAAMLLLILSRGFGWSPPVAYVSLFQDPRQNLTMMFLPCLVLGTASAAVFMRMVRSAMLDVMRQDYVRTARAKGLGEQLVLWRHVLKNSLIPVVTVAGVQVGTLLGGAIVTEQVFALPGVGRLVLDAVYQRDYPIVQGVVLFIAVSFMLSNLVVDGLYAYLDPRIRYE